MNPPGAAPTLITLAEDQDTSIQGCNDGTAVAIAKSLGRNEKLQPNRPISKESLPEKKTSVGIRSWIRRGDGGKGKEAE